MKRVLPVIVISQFFCTSLWFAGNAVINDIVTFFHLDSSYLAHLASAVQLGFISGTLVFAIFTISDRFSPSKIFFASAIVAALLNLTIVLADVGAIQLVLIRFLTGFFLAGIYPVGMKIVSDHCQQGLGKSLGFLVGALVLGTAFPHLLNSLNTSFSWTFVIYGTSLLSAAGGIIILLFVPDGPYRKPSHQFNGAAFIHAFQNPKFKQAAFGYFGHMWELYAFWVFVPVMLMTYQQHHQSGNFNLSALSFYIIASGSVACVAAGYLAVRLGVKKTATTALLLSCVCCLVSPLMLMCNSFFVFVSFLLFWGLVVIADSPLFSTLIATHAQPESKGTALTIVNCIGFSITIISIQLINILMKQMNYQYLYTVLAAGPLIGVIFLIRRNN